MNRISALSQDTPRALHEWNLRFVALDCSDLWKWTTEHPEGHRHHYRHRPPVSRRQRRECQVQAGSVAWVSAASHHL